MGAPKQKWTPEEEAALKAGIMKHGAGKWRTILKDPEFSGILYLRSNVDLKVGFSVLSVYFIMDLIQFLFLSARSPCRLSDRDNNICFPIVLENMPVCFSGSLLLFLEFRPCSCC